MIMMESLEKFGLGDSTSLLKKFVISQWGEVIHFQCLYDPFLRQPYDIILSDCIKVSYLIHSPENSLEELLSITDIQINKIEDSQQEFIIHTEVFELIVICATISVSKSTLLKE
jgi:hypothetical protein